MKTITALLKNITALCKKHRRRCYFDDGDGKIGVYSHRDVICWYQWTVAGYSLTGSTRTPQGARLRYLA